MLPVSHPELRALATGEQVACFAPRATVDEGDEVPLGGAGPAPPGSLKPAYAGWAEIDAPEGHWTAVVVAVHPAASLEPEAGAARHILASAPDDGDLLVLRVYGTDGEPVLSDIAFAARVRSLEGALR